MVTVTVTARTSFSCFLLFPTSPTSRVLFSLLLQLLQAANLAWVLILDAGADVWMEREVRSKVLEVFLEMGRDWKRDWSSTAEIQKGWVPHIPIFSHPGPQIYKLFALLWAQGFSLQSSQNMLFPICLQTRSFWELVRMGRGHHEVDLTTIGKFLTNGLFY